MNLPERHGRWPAVAAAAFLPVTAYAVREPRARPLAALLWHQTEEWVWPGDFLPWINREVIGSEDDEFPIDRRTAFLINVGFGWGLSLLAAAKPTKAVPATALYVSHVGNAALHVGWAAKNRRRDPGVVTALLTLLPAAAIGLRDIARDEKIERSEIGRGALLGVAIGAGMMPAMKLRLRLRSKSQSSAGSE